MLAINNTQPIKNQPNYANHSKISFTSEHNNSGKDSHALRNTLAGLALLGMVSCNSADDLIDMGPQPDYSARQKEIAICDSINKNRSLDEFMTNLGFLQDGNKLGNVKTISFEDINGTKHFLERGDSTEVAGHKAGIGFHAVDIDSSGNREEYDVKFEKYHQGLIVSIIKDNPNYKEGGIDTLKYEGANGKVRESYSPSTPKDTTVYRFEAKADGDTYTLQKAEGKGIIFYVPVADVKKTNSGLLFEGYDWIKEQRTSDIELLQNIRNNVAMPSKED